MSNILPLRCQRISCDCLFSDTSTKCVHHTQPPQFRDGEKLWPCCNKRSKDFNAFLSIKGCRELDSHSSEKRVVSPQTTRTTSAKEEKDDALGVEKCPRCSNGFACEMHPEESKKNEEKMRRVKELKEQKKREEELERAKMDPNALQTCKRTGCGMKFRESENTSDNSCRYHKGKPIFHERSKGWSCCASGKKAVYDFDEFLKIPPCAVGRHSAVVEEEEEGEEE